MEENKLSYRIDEAVKASGIGRTSLYQAMAEGRLKARKLGTRTLILKDDLKRFLESLECAAAA